MNKTNERYFNLAKLFNTLRLEGSSTQAELKEKLGLQASTISYLVNDLRMKGLVRNSDKNIGSPKVGKPGQPIELDNEYAYFLGLYLEETFIDAHIIGIADLEIYSQRIPLVQENPEKVPQQVVHIVRNILSLYDNIKGMGVAVKSVVDNDGNISSFKRTLIGSEGPKIWSVQGFSKALREAFPDLHIVVENDANCAGTYCQAVTKHRYENFMTFIINNKPFGIHMIDPQKVYRSGSLFSQIDEQTKKDILSLFDTIPYLVEVLVEAQYSLPAKGAVLLAVDDFVMDLLAMMDRR